MTRQHVSYRIRIYNSRNGIGNGIIAQLLWGLGGKLFSSLAGSENSNLQNYIYGLLLIGVAIWMLFALAEKYIQVIYEIVLQVVNVVTYPSEYVVNRVKRICLNPLPG